MDIELAQALEENAKLKAIISKILKAMEKAVITYEPKSKLTDVLNEAKVFLEGK